MPLTQPNSWTNLTNKPSTVAGLGLSDFNQKAIDAQAGATLGAVGTYAWLGDTGSVGYAPGATAAGSSLRYASIRAGSSFANGVPSAGTFGGGADTPAGTWRCLGKGDADSASFRATLWLRIA